MDQLTEHELQRIWFQMMNVNFWSTAVLLAILLCLETATEATRHKTNEVGSRRIDGHFCGDQIKQAYYLVCLKEKRRDGAAIMEEKKANSFLHSSRNSRRSRTDIVEECCLEGCAKEEIAEYCY